MDYDASQASYESGPWMREKQHRANKRNECNRTTYICERNTQKRSVTSDSQERKRSYGVPKL